MRVPTPARSPHARPARAESGADVGVALSRVRVLTVPLERLLALALLPRGTTEYSPCSSNVCWHLPYSQGVLRSTHRALRTSAGTCPTPKGYYGVLTVPLERLLALAILPRGTTEYSPCPSNVCWHLPYSQGVLRSTHRAPRTSAGTCPCGCPRTAAVSHRFKRSQASQSRRRCGHSPVPAPMWAQSSPGADVGSASRCADVAGVVRASSDTCRRRLCGTAQRVDTGRRRRGVYED